VAGSPANLVVVIDRDGVINEDSGEFIKSVDEWRPIAGSLEGIAALTRAGYRVVVVTNQSGIARGLLTEDVLHDIHEHMRSAVRAAGGELAAVYYCPHHPDEGCDCRKPRTALLRRAERELDVSLGGVPFIGDRTSDVQAAEAVGARPILVRTGSGAATARQMAPGRVEVFDDLGAAARALLTGPRG
jgi:D-glycero-D-manno-heptose 1,7-bisphosphate phosphatase